MQLALDLGLSSCLEAVRDSLRDHYGPMRLMPEQRLPPLDRLIRSILGCKTRDAVSLAAFERLRSACGGAWAVLLSMSPEAVETIIAPVTRAIEKAHQLRETLRIIRAQTGSLSLDFLANWPVEEAMQRLAPLHGVGPKVAAAALNFSTLKLRILVVDTHVWRVTQRLGLVGFKADAEAAQSILMRQVPHWWDAEDLAELHRLLKRLGQEVCHHRAPDCMSCPLQVTCPRLPFKGASEPSPLSD